QEDHVPSQFARSARQGPKGEVTLASGVALWFCLSIDFPRRCVMSGLDLLLGGMLLFGVAPMQTDRPRLEPLLPTGHSTYDVRCRALSADGKVLTSVSLEGTAIVWDAATGKKLRTLPKHSSFVWGAALSADGKLLALGAEDGTAVLWETTTGKKLQTF